MCMQGNLGSHKILVLYYTYKDGLMNTVSSLRSFYPLIKYCFLINFYNAINRQFSKC